MYNTQLYNRIMELCVKSIRHDELCDELEMEPDELKLIMNRLVKLGKIRKTSLNKRVHSCRIRNCEWERLPEQNVILKDKIVEHIRNNEFRLSYFIKEFQCTKGFLLKILNELLFDGIIKKDSARTRRNYFHYTSLENKQTIPVLPLLKTGIKDAEHMEWMNAIKQRVNERNHRKQINL